MSSGTELGLLEASSREQEVAEEVVVAVPLAAASSGTRKRFDALERLELARRILRLENRVAERPAHPVEHRGAAEEREPLRAQPVQVLGVEVRREEPVVAAQRDAGSSSRARSAGRIWRAPPAGAPPPSPRVRSSRSLTGLAADAAPARAQEQLGLAARQREIGRPELEQSAAAHPQP